MTLHIEAAGITHRGTVRDSNEDCIAIGYWTSQETMETARVFEHALDLPFACVVADGMGGHNDGERASLLVAKSLARRRLRHRGELVEAVVDQQQPEAVAHAVRADDFQVAHGDLAHADGFFGDELSP